MQPKTIRITVDLVVQERDGEHGSADKLRKALEQYLTGPDAPLREDYGKDAWGGYDGAYVQRARIVESSIEAG